LKNAAFRARELVNHILAVSRRAEEKRRHIRLKDVVKEAIKLLKSTIPSTINVSAHIDSEMVVFADSSQMHQVIMNLCTNAYHAMKSSGGELVVMLKDLVLRKEICFLCQRWGQALTSNSPSQIPGMGWMTRQWKRFLTPTLPLKGWERAQASAFQ
jgi:K+-sensing histidine kinase KdpD